MINNYEAEMAIKLHKQNLFKKGYKEENILGIFVYGSQNYNLDTEDSDWDTKAIIVPSFRDLVLEDTVSEQIEIYNIYNGIYCCDKDSTGEHCEVKDIREMVNMFKKQNINFIEILFTEYKWINPIYRDIWKKYFEDNRERIAYYDMYKTLESICGQSLHTIKQNPTNGKKIANAYRLYIFLMKYIKEKPYKECITLNDDIREFLLDLKKSEEELDICHSEFLINLFNTLKYGKQGFDLKNKLINTIVEEEMNKGILELMKINLPKEEEENN